MNAAPIDDSVWTKRWEARALYDYSAEPGSLELSFSEGDILRILSKDESGWWDAELRGVQGMIPSNYVKEL